jgi:DNA-binding NarL/FixJ family response regulator
MTHILLIEGHRLMRSALTDLLERHGAHRIDTASDPVEAVRIVMQLPPHIIILDSIWTEINGLYLSRMLRAMAPHAKIILLVDDSWAQDEDVRQSSGADAIIGKALLAQTLPPMLADEQLATESLNSLDSPSWR